MAKFVDYIDRQRLVEELTDMQRDLYDCKASEDAIMGISVARRMVQRFPSADVTRLSWWIPVTSESMPPEKDGLSDDLIIRAMFEGKCMIFVGFTRQGKWHTAMAHNSDILNGNIAVTHWMYADDLAKEAGHG